MATLMLQWSASAAMTPVGSGAGQPMRLTNLVDAPSAGSGTQPPQNLSSNTPVLSAPNSVTDSYYAEFAGELPQFYTATTSILVIIKWRSTGITSNVSLGAQIKATSDGETATRAYAESEEVSVAAPGTAGNFEYTTITLTNAGSNLDSAAPGDHVRLRIYREANDALSSAIEIFEVSLHMA